MIEIIALVLATVAVLGLLLVRDKLKERKQKRCSHNFFRAHPYGNEYECLSGMAIYRCERCGVLRLDRAGSPVLD